MSDPGDQCLEWVRYGPHAVLLRFARKVGEDAFNRCQAIRAELKAHPPDDLIESVPSFTSILLDFTPSASRNPESHLPELLERLEKRLEDWSRNPPPPSEPIPIPVQYDGPDLERVARQHDLTPGEVCELHAQPVYRVYLLGFSPGFPYLGDLDARLHTPRLQSPRPRVAAGSVAIGGEHTGIYSIDSPGGWNIIGHTTVKLITPDRGRATGRSGDCFFLKPGDRVRFLPEPS